MKKGAHQTRRDRAFLTFDRVCFVPTLDPSAGRSSTQTGGFGTVPTTTTGGLSRVYTQTTYTSITDSLSSFEPLVLGGEDFLEDRFDERAGGEAVEPGLGEGGEAVAGADDGAGFVVPPAEAHAMDGP